MINPHKSRIFQQFFSQFCAHLAGLTVSWICMAWRVLVRSRRRCASWRCSAAPVQRKQTMALLQSVAAKENRWYEANLQGGAPKIAKLFFHSNLPMVYGTYNELVTGANLNQLITGGPHLVVYDHDMIYILYINMWLTYHVYMNYTLIHDVFFLFEDRS